MKSGAITLGFIAVLMLEGCDAVTDDRALIQEARLLAVRASPPILAGPAARIELDSLLVDADGFRRESQPVIYRACSPWAFVSDPERDCPLASSLLLLDEQLGVEALLAFYPPPESAPNPMPPDPGTGESREEEPACDSAPVLEVPIVATTVVEGIELVTIKRVPIFLDEIERRNPRISTIELVQEFGDGPRRDERIVFSLAPDSLDALCGEDGEGLEPVRVHLYASSGELEPRTVDIVPTATGDIEPGEFRWTDADAGAMLWLVAIDRDGGVGWRNKDDI